MNYISLLSFIIALILTYVFLPMVKEMLISSGVLCRNFMKEEIPTAMGLVFIFAQVITLGILQIFLDLENNFNLIYLFGYVFIGLVGLLDDLIGDKEIKGLKGHIKSFFRGKLTTGGIKAFLGLFISLVVSSYLSSNLLEFLVNGLIIGLFTNLINLFDLRPGRASKVFIILSVLLLLFSGNKDNNYIILSLYGMLIPYISLDLNSKVMMGDTGANILGYSLGIYAAANYNIVPKIIILIILVVVHLLAEKVSFSKIIEENKYLKSFDNMGR